MEQPTGTWQMATHLELGLRPAAINLAWQTERKTKGQRIAKRSCHTTLRLRGVPTAQKNALETGSVNAEAGLLIFAF